jgi:hypothetical protein
MKQDRKTSETPKVNFKIYLCYKNLPPITQLAPFLKHSIHLYLQTEAQILVLPIQPKKQRIILNQKNQINV